MVVQPVASRYTDWAIPAHEGSILASVKVIMAQILFEEEQEEDAKLT
jgi:hypothetical protein